MNVAESTIWVIYGRNIDIVNDLGGYANKHIKEQGWAALHTLRRIWIAFC